MKVSIYPKNRFPQGLPVLKSCFLLLVWIAIAGLQALHAQDAKLSQLPQTQTDSIDKVLQIEALHDSGFNFWENRFKGNWAGVFLGVNGFAQTDYSMYPEHSNNFMEPTLWKSNCLSINLIQISQRLQRNRNFIGLVTGLGADFQSYRFDNDYSIEKGLNRVEPVLLTKEEKLKSKFSSVYLSVPMLIEFQIPVKHFDNRLYFSTGVIGSLRLNTHTKVKYEADGKKQKIKDPGDYYLRDFRFSGTIRVGYRRINLFATYDLQPLFTDQHGPRLYPFTLGIGLITF
ncbi:outer membrane beta-barrel protein [Mangrovibacterium marinum]|uniref:Outer membrane protein with beta-barrel domain n=1 Tax=Mangrovibacterium marinum TaxID=1639118 RepID=A0A2T5C2N9_9BACT|nr:outer membrane beta-barrel protein [Mangrovibacterium marinum]PTN08952.1 outer membrane protein with beta-barrel domain [Mangrovibacterium marinum]